MIKKLIAFFLGGGEGEGQYGKYVGPETLVAERWTLS